MDKIINYLLLTIIFVFDPLAISLVIAANYAFERLQKTKNVIEEKTVDVFDKDDIQVQQFNEEEKDPKLEEQENLESF